MKKLFFCVVMVLFFCKFSFADNDSIWLNNQREKILKAKDMVNILMIVSERGGIPICIEGMPLRLSVASQEMMRKDIEETNILTNENIFDILCKYYGYEYNYYKGIFVFRKNYKRLEDVPVITIAELNRFYLVSFRILKPYVGLSAQKATEIDSRLLDLSQKLTEEEWGKLRPVSGSLRLPNEENGEKTRQKSAANGIFDENGVSKGNMWTSDGIRISDISPEKRQLVRQIAYGSIIGSDSFNINRGLDMIRETQSASTKIYYKGYSELSCLTCERDVNGKKYYTPFTPVNRVSINFGSAAILGSESKIKEMYAKDSSEPLFSDYDEKGLPVENYEINEKNKNLVEFAKILSNAGDKNVYVQEEIGNKKITFLHMEKLTQIEALNVLSVLFNLQVDDSEGKFLLQMPDTPIVRTVNDVPDAISKVMPAPLDRLCKAWKEAGWKQFIDSLPQRAKNSDGTLKKNVNTGRNSRAEMDEGSTQTLHAAIHRFRVLVDPKIKADSDGVLDWEQLGEEEKWLMVYILASPAIRSIYSRSESELPACITDFENCTLHAEKVVSQGREWLRVGVRSSRDQSSAAATGVIRFVNP